MEYAIIFLKSDWNNPTSVVLNIVKEPKQINQNKTILEYSKIKEHFINKKTPAVTIVAAWIKAETGVGPAIASGNQACKPNCADLPITPIVKKKAIKPAKDQLLTIKKI